MKSFTQLFAFLLVLLLSPLSHAATVSLILYADGDGDTIEEAKASALTALSQSIISKVESVFSSEVGVANEKVNRNIKSKKKVESEQILQGVQYVNESQDANGFHITAGLDRDGVASTLDFMRNKIDVKLDLLNRDQIVETLVISEKLTAFVSALPESALFDNEEIQSWNNDKRELLLKHLNQGKVKFISEAKPYSVKVDGKPVESGQFLEAGSYVFEASAEGFRSVTGSFTVSAGELVKVSIPFIQDVANKRITLEYDADYKRLRESAVDVLKDLGVDVQTSAPNGLVIQISDHTDNVESFVSHQLKVKIVAEKNGKQFKKVTLKDKFVIDGDDMGKVDQKIESLIRKGLIALMSKMDLDEYFSAEK